MKMPPLVKVIWEDAGSTNTNVWTNSKDKLEWKSIVHDQTGYLVYDGPEGVMLSSSWNEELMASPEQIPRGMIRAIHRLSVGTKRRSS